MGLHQRKSEMGQELLSGLPAVLRAQVAPQEGRMTPTTLAALEDALRDVGDWGTVELVIQNGRVAFVHTKRSVKLIDGRQQELPVT
jgi:hypothetical protein